MSVDSQEINSLDKVSSVTHIAELLKTHFLSQRRSLLDELDRLERMLGIYPRTAEIRRMYKNAKKAASK